MTTSSLAELPSAFFLGQDRNKGPLVPELVTPSYRADIVGFPTMDATAHGEFGRAFYSAFPDLYHTIDEVVVAEGHVTLRFTLRGTQHGQFMHLPPTGRPVEVPALVMLSVVDGRVNHLRAIFDQLGLLQQLGAIPS
jgi:predicted ester cyclase